MQSVFDSRIGEKINYMYFGEFNSIKISKWYRQINEIVEDWIAITHLAYTTEKKVTSNISNINRVKNRCENIIKQSPLGIRSLNLMCVDPKEEWKSTCYILDCGVRKSIKKSTNEALCALLSFDISIMNSIKFNQCRDVTKECSNWYKEVIFKCSAQDIPINYGLFQNPEVFKKIEIISEEINQTYK